MCFLGLLWKPFYEKNKLPEVWHAPKLTVDLCL